MLSSIRHHALSRRYRDPSTRRRRPHRRLQAESLECRRLLAGDLGDNSDPHGEPNPDEPFPTVTITGVKWEDANENGVFDRGERGLPGVTIYSDQNGNGLFDDFEPHTVTGRDIVETPDRNEAGSYTLDGLEPGMHFVREVVPGGFRQTFPGFGPHPFDPADGGGGPVDPVDELATVQPPRINVNLEFGEPFVGDVSLTIHPLCFRPYEVDVVASDPDIEVINESGVQLNGCGGDTSTFQVVIFGHEMTNREFELQFVDAEFGGVLAAIPVHFTRAFDGAHIVEAPHGGFFPGIDFGNVRLFEAGSVHGRKWSDDNGNGVQDGGEEGLAGVRIYADLNENGEFDRGEPSTFSMRDDPETDFDEAGLYWLDGLRPGRNVIREVAPAGYRQTFPGLTSSVISSETGRFHPGVAMDLDITGVSIASDLNAPAADIELTVIWPDSCGDLISDLSAATIVDNTILVSLHGHQVGDVCLTVISPQTETVRVPSLDLRQYDVVVTLNEELRDGSTRATLNAVGAIALGGFGSHVVRVEPGQAVERINFGNWPLPPGSAHGTKWTDENGNGRREDGEEPLPGVVIYSDLNFNGRLDEGEPRTETMDDGAYWLEGLRPGMHVISEVIPDGFIQTFPGQVGIFDATLEVPFDIWNLAGHVVQIESGQEATELDFGNQPIKPGSIHGTKWVDENGNGVRDDGEPGLPGVTIYADLNYNGQFDDDEPHAVTMEDFNDDLIDDNGKYWLEGLVAGDYAIREVVPDGSVQTYPRDDIWFVGDPGQPWPDQPFPDQPWPPFFGGGAHYVWLGNGEEVTGIDFGNQPIKPGSIHGTKWLDENGNGVRDEGEPGLAGVTIYSDLNNNGVLDDGEPHTVSMEDLNDDLIDDTGKYWLEDLSAGIHFIREIVPDDFVQTFPERWPLPLPLGPWPDGIPIDPTLGIPIDPTFGDGAHVVLLGVGEVVEGIDFGNRRYEPASVHGTKWLDRNGNGQRDPGEPGLAEVVIYADVDMDGVFSPWEPHTRTMPDDLDTTDEDETGRYWLEGLEPGGYVIREVVPDGFVQTYPPFDFWPDPFIGADGQPIDDFPMPPPNDNGGHWVWLEVGDKREGIDFGNQPIDAKLGSLQGRKWSDRNGNGERDPGEPGLPGVTIWLDANLNGVFDATDPQTRTMRDDPQTRFDEAGRYWFNGLEAGFYVVHEVVPDGFEPTYPEPFACLAIFCNGHGHMVNLEPGETIDGLDFGNQPMEFEAGAIAGFKWLDRNGNGRMDADEPGLPGVTIYLDLNDNGVLDPREPSTESRFDDPSAGIREAGHFRFDHVKPGEYVVREVVPEGFEQTFPQVSSGHVIELISLPREPRAVHLFDLVDVGESITADGTVGLGLTYLLHHEPELCAPIINSSARFDDVGRIHVEMVARPNPLARCADEPMETLHTVVVAGISSGRYETRAELFESFGDDERLSFVNEAVVEIARGNGSHIVVVEPNQTTEGVHFGNRRVGDGPSLAIWDGEALIGEAGDGANWEDPDNWTVDGEADHMPSNDGAANVGADVILAPGGAETIHIGAHHTVNSLRIMDDYHLAGDRLTISSGVVQVDAGAVGTMELRLTGPVVKSGAGTLILAADAGDVTVSAGVLGGAATLGHLQVGPAAIVAPGASTGMLQVASANFEPDSTLAIEIDSLGAGLQHDFLASSGAISIEGTLALELMDGFDGLVPGESASLTILQGSTIQGRFANPSGWQHLDSGVFYQLTYDATTVGVQLRRAQPGDLNGDGTVDGTDLGTWSENRFTFGDWQHGDFNNDHVVDGSDFGIWLENRFQSRTAEAVAATPRVPRAAAASGAIVAPAVMPTGDVSHAPLTTHAKSPASLDSARRVDHVVELEFDRFPVLHLSRSARNSAFVGGRSGTGTGDNAEVRLDGDDWTLEVDVAMSQVGFRHLQ